MASTIELQRTINRSQQMIRLAPLIFAENTANDPAFSNADWVMQTILAPPFAWRWNRTSASPQVPTFTTTTGVTDYEVSLPNFGWIEKATCYDLSNGVSAQELQVGLIYAADTLPNQPTRIAAVLDNGSGTITFRVFPAPDRPYSIVVESQNAAQLFTSTTQTWAPIPDYMSVVFNTGFDYRAMEYMNDPRSQETGQLFYSQLANFAEGLTDSQKNLWLQDRINSMRETAKAQQGR
jgi:hypothetical protein